MEMTRKWAMPNSETFSIKPIHDLLVEECGKNGENGYIIDPFARNNHEFATVTNDFNPECSSDYHMDGLDFMKNTVTDSVDIVLYDPPYSPRQVSEVYNHVGVAVTQETTSAAWRRKHLDEIARIVRVGGKCISFGWNSNGVGKKRGFEIERVLLVPHGGSHNDTIVTVEKRIR